MTRSYVVYEEAKMTVEAASKEEAVEAAWGSFDELPWETFDEEPNQDTEVTCEEVQGVPAVVGENLVAQA
jgi:hypothetical protein